MEQETITNQRPLTNPPLAKSPYILHKPLKNNLFLVRRITDGQILVAHPLESEPSSTSSHDHAQTTELIRRGAGRAAANLLNHENIVSVYDELVDLPLSTTTTGPTEPGDETAAAAAAARRMFLWDYCDAGTLHGAFETYPWSEDEHGAGYLPEGFVWHVALGVLKALRWLHEGEREGVWVERKKAEDWAAEGGWGGSRVYRKVRVGVEREEDWMPVLHRDLRAEKVFLQHPRGTETYGAVKLGGFEKCFVSGSVCATRKTPVVTMEEEDVTLGELRERVAGWKAGSSEMTDRPYTHGSELYALGLMLYRMISGRILIDQRGCGCSEDTICHHDYVGDEGGQLYLVTVWERLTKYTDNLKDLVALLLRQRDDLSSQTTWPTSEVYTSAWQGYQEWAEETEDGRLHRDMFDDMWFRKQNQLRLRNREMGEEAVQVDEPMF